MLHRLVLRAQAWAAFPALHTSRADGHRTLNVGNTLLPVICAWHRPDPLLASVPPLHLSSLNSQAILSTQRSDPPSSQTLLWLPVSPAVTSNGSFCSFATLWLTLPLLTGLPSLPHKSACPRAFALDVPSAENIPPLDTHQLANQASP